MYWHGELTGNGRKKLIPYRISETDEEILLPCGRCSSCRVNKSREWAVRCVCEAKSHENNYFLTLTIDDDHLKDSCGNIGVKNLMFAPTACMDDLTAFVKRLRADQDYHHDNRLKWFGCTEYGDSSNRPHGHMILFGPILDDLKPWTKSGSNWLYRSEYLESKWKQGNILVGEMTAESAQYVAKYCSKVTDEYKKSCEELGVEVPKLRMSRNPGIGIEYLKHHRLQILNDNGIYIHGKLVPIPEYWKEMYMMEEEYIDRDDHDTDLLKKAIKEQKRHNGGYDPLYEYEEFEIKPKHDVKEDRNKV